eukprot:COSAG02_NODE_2182_length_9582_cov_4.266582_8_plen_43_part_00
MRVGVTTASRFSCSSFITREIRVIVTQRLCMIGDTTHVTLVP